MIEHICDLGGDTDTIAAMAGAMWGAFNGSAPIDETTKGSVEGILEIENLASSIYEINN